MGTDLHLYLEHKNAETGNWEPMNLYIDKNGEKKYVDIYHGRYYLLFGQLAGVRVMIEPFVYPRGLPNDLSDFVREEYEKGNDKLDNDETVNWFHDMFWYDYVELKLYSKTDKATIEDWEKEPVNPTEDLMRDIDFVLDMYDIWDPKPGDIRIVGWFDS